MDTKTVLDLLMARLGNKTEPEFRTLCLSEMIMAQETQLEGGPDLPWFLEKASNVLSTSSGLRTVALPEDFIREVDEDVPLYYLPADGGRVKLEKKGYQELENWYETEEGAPAAYALLGEEAAIFPLPNDIFSIQFPAYYGRQPAPADTTGDENAWLKWASDLVIATTGEVMAIQHLQGDNQIFLQSFSAMRQRAVQRLEVQAVARQEANRDRRMG